MSSWATLDRRTLVNFAGAVLEVFSAHVQLGDTDREAGGLLLGTVHGSHMLVEQATIPTALDKRFRHRFERLPFGHSAVAQSRWLQTGGQVRYLGEWHTHPEPDPNPSLFDRIEWQRLAANRNDHRAMLVVIVGRRRLHVEVVSEDGVGAVLIPIG